MFELTTYAKESDKTYYIIKDYNNILAQQNLHNHIVTL